MEVFKSAVKRPWTCEVCWAAFCDENEMAREPGQIPDQVQAAVVMEAQQAAAAGREAHTAANRGRSRSRSRAASRPRAAPTSPPPPAFGSAAPMSPRPMPPSYGGQRLGLAAPTSPRPPQAPQDVPSHRWATPVQSSLRRRSLSRPSPPFDEPIPEELVRDGHLDAMREVLVDMGVRHAENAAQQAAERLWQADRCRLQERRREQAAERQVEQEAQERAASRPAGDRRFHAPRPAGWRPPPPERRQRSPIQLVKRPKPTAHGGLQTWSVPRPPQRPLTHRLSSLGPVTFCQ